MTVKKKVIKVVHISILMSLFPSCLITAQESKLAKGILQVGKVKYSVSIDETSPLILIGTEDIFDKTINFTKANPGKHFMPSNYLALNVADLLRIKREILGEDVRISVRFFCSADGRLIDLAYDLRKEKNITVNQFKKLDQQIRENFRGSIPLSEKLQQNYMPYIGRTIIFK